MLKVKYHVVQNIAAFIVCAGIITVIACTVALRQQRRRGAERDVGPRADPIDDPNGPIFGV